MGEIKAVRKEVGRDEEVSKGLGKVSNSNLFSCSLSIRDGCERSRGLYMKRASQRGKREVVILLRGTKAKGMGLQSRRSENVERSRLQIPRCLITVPWRRPNMRATISNSYRHAQHMAMNTGNSSRTRHCTRYHFVRLNLTHLRPVIQLMTMLRVKYIR